MICWKNSAVPSIVALDGRLPELPARTSGWPAGVLHCGTSETTVYCALTASVQGVGRAALPRALLALLKNRATYNAFALDRQQHQR